MYGRGLSIHTFEDKNIDFDNSLVGFEYTNNINDRIDVFAIISKNDIKNRLYPDEIVSDISSVEYPSSSKVFSLNGSVIILSTKGLITS